MLDRIRKWFAPRKSAEPAPLPDLEAERLFRRLRAEEVLRQYNEALRDLERERKAHRKSAHLQARLKELANERLKMNI